MVDLIIDTRCFGNITCFFSDIYSRNRKSAASLEACLLTPIKTLAYVVPGHTYYFHLLEEFGKRACRKFNATIIQCYMDKFLHLSMTADIKSMAMLFKSQNI